MSESDNKKTETFIANNTSFVVKSLYGMKKLEFTTDQAVLIEFNAPPSPKVEMNPTIIATISGIFLLLIVVVLSIFYPDPSGFQLRAWLSILSLAGGAFATIIPGLIDVNIDLGRRLAIMASGSIAIFIVLYMVVPVT